MLKARILRPGIMSALLALACTDPSVDTTREAVGPQFGRGASYNLKFTFTGQELDGDGASNDVIEAHSRLGGGGANTTCVYASDGGAWEIGRYYGETWSSDVGSEVLAFCLQHLGDLQPNTTRFNYQAYFDDVQFTAGPVGDISAHSKASKHAPYTSCVYYTADGATHLGNFGAAQGFSLKSDLGDWCALHYPDRTDTEPSNPR